MRAARAVASYDAVAKTDGKALDGDLPDAMDALSHVLYEPAESLSGAPDQQPVTDDRSFDANADRLWAYDPEFHARVQFARMAGQRLYRETLSSTEQEILSNGAKLGAYAMVMTPADIEVRDKAWIDRYLNSQLLVPDPKTADLAHQLNKRIDDLEAAGPKAAEQHVFVPGHRHPNANTKCVYALSSDPTGNLTCGYPPGADIHQVVEEPELQPHAWRPGNGRDLTCTIPGCGKESGDPIHNLPRKTHAFEKQYVHGQPVEECGRSGCGLWIDDPVHELKVKP